MGNGKPKPIVIVQGGQMGSESKGSVAAHLCLTRGVDFAVRTGSVNAGHSVVYRGIKYAMQQLPTGWVHPSTKLVIGAGAYVHPEVLSREIDMVNTAMPESDVVDRLIIDHRCGTHLPEHAGIAADANRHHRMGATGKGCSVAVVSKIRDRNDGYKLFKEWWGKGGEGQWEGPDRLQFDDTSQLLNNAYDAGAKILIEGTQGTHLDLNLGPYPFVTNRMTSAANWVAECGLAPGLQYETILVVRTYPIRVAGNSGPMSGEIEWSDLAVDINQKLRAAGREPLIGQAALDEWDEALYAAASKAEEEGRYEVPLVGPNIQHDSRFMQYNIRLSEWRPADRDQWRVAASELHRDALAKCSDDTQRELRKLFEMTTVTKKLRRIAKLDMTDLKRAVEINRPSSIALTFLDYIEPVLARETAWSLGDEVADTTTEQAIERAQRFIFGFEKALGVPVKLVSTGPEPDHTFGSGVIMHKQRSER